MKFVIGDRTAGYSYSYGPRTWHGLQKDSTGKGEPWSTQVWQNGKVVRRDHHRTAAEAINYCHGRYERFFETGSLKVHIGLRKLR